MSAVLETIGLTAGYGSTVVVRGVDLAVDEGEIVCLLGPNGAGKTTTLLTLAGVLPPLGGEARVLGEKVPSAKPHVVARRGAALVPEQRALFYGLTVRENLRLGSRSGGISEDQLLDYFPELRPRLKTRAGSLSGGEQQMLALGRALAGGPRVLLVDEMSLGLAPVIVSRLLGLLRVITSELGASVLLVEQQIEHALGVSDRAYILRNGEVVLQGRSRELRAQSDHLHAAYLGARSSLTSGDTPDE